MAPRKIEYKRVDVEIGLFGKLTFWICQVCGAMCADTNIHDDYHQTGR